MNGAFGDLLRLTAAAGRSLAFNVHRGGKPFGCVMMLRGKIAWAVSSEQPVMLGDFLVRSGHLDREQFSRAQAAFRAAGGRKKLGAVLEELGLISRPALRRCLLLHTQEALTSLLSHRDLDVSSSPTPQQEDDALLFSLEEVLGEAAGRPARMPALGDALDLRPLTALFAIPGYAASAVAARDGELLSAHAGRSGVAIDHAAVHAAALLDAGGHLGRDGGLGAARMVVSRHEGGAVIACWLGAPGHLAVLMLDDPSREADATGALAAARPLLDLLSDLASAGDLAREALVRAPTPAAQVEALRLAIELRMGELRARGEDPGEVERLRGSLAGLDLADEAAAVGAVDAARAAWSGRPATA
ncbi:MAG: hypothetical protein U0229_19025 [Anaeromyxobacter sp.]